MNSKKGKRLGRVERKQKATREAAIAKAESDAFDGAHLRKQAQDHDARCNALGVNPLSGLAKLSVKDRKRFKKPLYSKEEQESIERNKKLTKEIMAKCQGREIERK